ncbi:MAG TPA: pyridoxamine 5'-phosphate oxidase family protein [Tepidiformaceae bacterium]|jgi:nitroimidazol reductase NimA-like FMN-containing flavoprotein (pyridoxamine 5'-phosphate oxidase superfamily)|nr:pyridoxamine 5'-phosphate oxidase family protein [Thermoflexaceae bacterium]HMS58059.1 pyridoxamine 5'-phosphate oxidase family protein [Tepidiformaceae bacterium]
MPDVLSSDAILDYATTLAKTQPGATLATIHAEFATPYQTYVLFHLRPNGQVIFASSGRPQHARNIASTPEVSFLIDNRDIMKHDWQSFDRVVIEGRARQIAPDDAEFVPLAQELTAKDASSSYFIREGHLFLVEPRRLVLMKGLEPHRHVVDFEG